jgi:methylated-DNA-protein-cysteine methyltransferase-like protein
MKPKGAYEKIYRIIRRIPRGRVATYGQIAKLAGLAGSARRVGYALHVVPDGARVPWHRVINARGEISLRRSGESPQQRTLLEKEGVVFDAEGRVSLTRYGWVPGRQA